MISWSDLPTLIALTFLEIALSSDNAIVLSLLSRSLPAPLRKRALFAGLISSLFFRAVGLFSVAYLLEFAWIRLLGALYLLYLAVRHFIRRPPEELEPIRRPSFWGTVLLIELYDLAFALDSIVAGVAFVGSSSKLWIVYFGGIIGLVTIRFAAVLFSKLIDLFPRLETSAYLMIGWIGLKLGLDAYAAGFDVTLIPSHLNAPFLWIGILLSLSYGLSKGKRT